MLVIFAALIAGPIVAGKQLKLGDFNLPMELLQPTGINNNDTKFEITGSRLNNAGGDAPLATGASSATSTDDSLRLRAF